MLLDYGPRSFNSFNYLMYLINCITRCCSTTALAPTRSSSTHTASPSRRRRKSLPRPARSWARDSTARGSPARRTSSSSSSYARCRRPARAAQGPHPRGRQPDLPVLAWPLLPLLRLGPARRPARARCDARRARRLLRQREEEACPPALLEPSRALPRLRADGRQGARLREGVRGVAHLARERAALAGDARAPAEAPARGAGG